MKEIELTQGFVALVDDEDYEAVSQYAWRYHRSNRTGYARGFRRVDGRDQHVYMHRLLTAAPRGRVVDHIDGNGLNNQRANLRLCTPTQNTWNKRRRGGRWPYRGVLLVDPKRSKPWQARISSGGRIQCLGYFADIRAAARAYDAAAKERFGDFARLNFPDAP